MLQHVVRTVNTGLTGYMRTGKGKEPSVKYDFIYIYRLGYFYTTFVKEFQKNALQGSPRLSLRI